jgi:hypothetical protein
LPIAVVTRGLGWHRQPTRGNSKLELQIANEKYQMTNGK